MFERQLRTASPPPSTLVLRFQPHTHRDGGGWGSFAVPGLTPAPRPADQIDDQDYQQEQPEAAADGRTANIKAAAAEQEDQDDNQ